MVWDEQVRHFIPTQSLVLNFNLILISYQTNTYVDQVEIAITIGEDHDDGIRRHRLPTSTIESFLT